MVQVNENYLKLKAGYLFPEIAKRVKLYSQANNSSNIIKLGIGDVTEPLPKACINAMSKALNEMGTNKGFKGYGPEQGYGWLREKISENDFISRGCQISPEEIFKFKFLNINLFARKSVTFVRDKVACANLDELISTVS